MRLYHRTDREAAEAILAMGFGVSHVGDSDGGSWLSASPIDCATSGDWVVIVELPNGLADRYHHRFHDGEQFLSNRLVPWEVLNTHRPFILDPWSAVAPDE